MDQCVLDFLEDRGLPYVDGLAKHVEDFQDFSVVPADYPNRYYIGHYGPRGNHFFAFAIKNALVKWLDPKPPTYQGTSEAIDFEGYLPD